MFKEVFCTQHFKYSMQGIYAELHQRNKKGKMLFLIT